MTSREECHCEDPAFVAALAVAVHRQGRNDLDDRLARAVSALVQDRIKKSRHRTDPTRKAR